MTAPGAMDPEQWRRLGHRLVDWIADYHARVESLPVQPPTTPGEVLAALPAAPPEHGLDERGWDDVVADLDRLIVPHLTHWQSPRFFGYFPSNASGPAILGELLSAGLAVQGMLWATGPAATELEERMLDWLGQALGLPASFRQRPGGGCIQGTASEATLVALVAARERARKAGATLGQMTLYTSSQAHSSVAKAARIAGLEDRGDDAALRLVPVDAQLAMVPAALAERVRADREAGRRPFFVCATVGTTSSCAVDPLADVAAALGAADFDGWLHVDAAYAGTAAVCPEHRGLLDGIEHVDSLCTNPHKALLVNFDCCAFWVKDRVALTDALAITPAYLRNRASDSGAVTDYRDWQVPLGRRFRALKLWLVMRHYGLSGLRAHVRHGVALASEVAARVRDDPRFELVAQRLGLVCFRLRGQGDDADARNRALLERVNASGAALLTHTMLPIPAPDGEPRLVLRMAIGGTTTERRHVIETWQRIAAE